MTPTNTEANVLSEVLKEEGFTPANGGTPNANGNANGNQNGQSGNGNANGNAGNAGNEPLIINEDEGGSGGNQGGNAGQGQNANGGQAKPENWKPGDADWSAYLAERFGEGNADAIKTKLTERDHFERLTKADPYKSALGGQLDELLGKGVKPENAIRYLTVDAEQLVKDGKFRELRELTLGMERPDLTPQEISDLIDMKYGIGKSKKDDDSEKMGLLQLKFDVGADKEKFAELKKKLIEPASNNRDRVQADFNNTQRVKSWEGHTKKLVEEFTSLNIPVGLDKEGKPLRTVAFKIKDKSVLERLSKDMQTIIEKSPSLAADADGIALLKEIAEDRVWKLLKPQIAQSLVQSGVSDKNKFWSKTLHNTQLDGQNGAHDFGGSANTSEDAFVEAIVGVEQGKR